MTAAPSVLALIEGYASAAVTDGRLPGLVAGALVADRGTAGAEPSPPGGAVPGGAPTSSAAPAGGVAARGGTAAVGRTGQDAGPLQPGARLRIASITKSMVATLVMCLVGDGRLSLDEPVCAVLPGLRLADPRATATLTPRHLLSHTSGLVDPVDFAALGDGTDAFDNLVGAVGRLRPRTLPGRTWRYGNAGYCLLGAVIEAATGQPFEDVLRQRLLDPLGMAGTSFEPDSVTVPGHERRQRHRFVPAPVERYARARRPSAGLYAPVADLLAFARLQLGERPDLLAPERLAELHRPYTSTSWGSRWALGWQVEPYRTEVLSHLGDYGGYSSLLVLVPARGFALALLGNASAAGALRGVAHRTLATEYGLSFGAAPILRGGGYVLRRAVLAARYRVSAPRRSAS